uniref:GAIN-B domain-containing protein n=1 Tax=Ciona savignyi TaxID=51511 RepID=H2ZHF2_CIOSA
MGFRLNQVHLFRNEKIPENVTASISLPISTEFDELVTSKRISFLAYSNDKLFLSANKAYYDVNSLVILSATVKRTPVKNLKSPVIVQFMTNKTMSNVTDVLSICVYWDEVNRIWSCDGSIKVEETDNWVVC